ncbi:LLM class flavin-dependent oxidoreductase [Actinotalea sp. BY-33]|uniref:LLM class flavin-dependent oxidoreductase n=1 Tax=Actinotalea soli TaxID=2819234 RepID=A0A939RVP8_9CELL|nr:LLM class flavin-dependent oxidoreductase [Actinotalea soli]MBO1751361.1 LLM class flavin-dependent oxidoreductase [Actinotalea soli]
MSDTRAVGVMLPRDLPAAVVLDYARRAESLGFDELWVVEDLGFRGGVAQAAAVLAVTERIRVGVGVLPAAVRNAAFTAMEVATLAQLFPGRVDVGIGHGMPGWMRSVGAWPASPLRLLEDHLRSVRALLGGDAVEGGHGYVEAEGVRLEPSAVPAVAPRVLAGVRGPRSLALAGRAADGTVLAEPCAPEYIRQAIAQIDAPGPHRVVTYDVAAVDEDGAAARDVVRGGLEWIGETDWSPHLDPLPFAEEFRALRARSVTREEFVAAMPDAWVQRLALAGTPAEVRGQIDARHEAGATVVVMVPIGPDPMAALEAVARVL